LGGPCAPAVVVSKFMKCLLVGAVLALLSAGVAKAASDRADVASARNTHLEYFGFYASAMWDWNYTAELAPYTNLTWIHVGPEWGMERMVARVAEARLAGVGAVLSIEPWLFANARGDLRPGADILDDLVELRTRLEAEALLDTLVMIYPKDEPFREFVRHRDPNFVEEYVTGEVYEDVYEVLVEANDLVRAVFPEKPIGVILSGYELAHRFFSIPENYDWVGYNCYMDLFRGCSDRSALDLYGILLEHMQPHQRLVAVPETWAVNESVTRADWPDVLGRRLSHHLEIAMSDPRFIAVIPFIWSFDAEGDTPGLGLDRFPALYDDNDSDAGTGFMVDVLALGQSVKAGELYYPNMAWSDTENSAWRPRAGQDGGIIGIDADGNVDAWAIDDALPHKNLRVRLLARDESGDLVYKSRLQRTNRAIDTAGQLDLVGRHAARFPLPASLTATGRPLRLTLEIYADGPRPGAPLRISATHTPPVADENPAQMPAHTGYDTIPPLPPTRQVSTTRFWQIHTSLTTSKPHIKHFVN